MAQIIQKAPGKIILFGEHAVVYGKPAIAAPVTQCFTTVTIQPLIHELQKIQIEAPDIHLSSEISSLPHTHPFVQIISQIQERNALQHLPSMQIHIHSSLPVAAGLGSGASVSVALARAISAFLGLDTRPETISQIAFAAEKCYHGNPSGIDNTVIAYEKPIYFQREKPIQWLKIKKPLHLLIIQSGEEKSTKNMVALVRQKLTAEPATIQSVLDQIEQLTNQARKALETGKLTQVGDLMTQNHHLLMQLGVSTPGLNSLVSMALEQGALGAKLSGAGGGGNVILLTPASASASIMEAFLQAGYQNQIQTIVH